jgi:hypothetical protein
MICLNDLFVEDLRTVAYSLMFGSDAQWIELAASNQKEYIGERWAVRPLDTSSEFTSPQGVKLTFVSLFEMEGKAFELHSVEGNEQGPSERPLGI